MSRAFRGWMTVLIVVVGAIPIVASTALLDDRPALAFLLLLTGTAVLVMARAAWRWMGEPADPQRG